MRRVNPRPTANQQLRRARELRGWSQQRVAEAVGTNKVMVSRWEGGVMAPSPHFRAQLCELFGQTAEDLGFITVSRPAEDQAAEPSNPPLWQVPFKRNPCFTGREAILARLYAALHAKGRASVTQALCGLGGVGKTQTALEYTYRFRDQYQAILWVRAETRDLLLADLAALAPLLGVASQGESDQSQAVQAVRHWLSTHLGWLLILDNVEDLSLLEQILSTAHQGQVLLTTRSLITGTHAQSIVLESMDPAEGALFLLRRAKLLMPEAPLAEAAESLQNPAFTLTTLLGGLPLALDQAGAYLEETGRSLNDYLTLYDTRRACLLDRRGTAASDHPASVRTTFALALEQVELASPASADLLRLCAMLHPEAIPEELFSTGAAEMGTLLGPVAADPLALDEALVTLRRFALLYRDPVTRTFSLHRLVQTVLLDDMDEATHDLWAERAVRSMNRAFPDSTDEALWNVCQRFLPHAQACAARIATLPLASLEAGQLLDKLGIYCNQQGHHAEAEALLLQASTLLHDTVGERHPAFATCLNDLAVVYIYQGRFAQAESLYQRALAIRQELFDANHPAMLESLHNLGHLFMSQGKYAQAAPLLEQAVEMGEAIWGAHHRNVARLLHNLGALYARQGRFAEAELLFQRALVIRQETLGGTHRHTLSTMSWVAIISGAQRKFAQAEALHRQVLAEREQQLGSAHSEVAENLHYLAWLAHEQGRYTEAEPLYQRTLAIRMETLGASHPQTLRTRHHLARLALDCGQEEQAEALGQEVLRLREQTLGADHPEVAETLDLLARVSRKQGCSDEAAFLDRRAQAIREQALGVTSSSSAAHPSTLAPSTFVQRQGRPKR